MSKAAYNAQLYHNGQLQSVADCLADEEALQIIVNGEPFTITMRSPGHEEELARGLLFTEGLYRDEKTAPGFEISTRNPNGTISAVEVRINENDLLRHFSGERHLASTSSCGLCGKTSLDSYDHRPVNRKFQITPEKVVHFFDLMRAHQPEFGRSGGTHAAAMFNTEGDLLTVREDIGRHNAVDKVIGAMLYAGKLQEAACMAVSGRISYEIVSKALSAGVALLASVSAPSTLAIETAHQNGLTLLAFCRGDKFTIYTHPERIHISEPVKQI